MLHHSPAQPLCSCGFVTQTIPAACQPAISPVAQPAQPPPLRQSQPHHVHHASRLGPCRQRTAMRGPTSSGRLTPRTSHPLAPPRSVPCSRNANSCWQPLPSYRPPPQLTVPGLQKLRRSCVAATALYVLCSSILPRVRTPCRGHPGRMRSSGAGCGARACWQLGRRATAGGGAPCRGTAEAAGCQLREARSQGSPGNSLRTVGSSRRACSSRNAKEQGAYRG